MSHSIKAMPRPVRRRLKNVVQKTSDKDYARRAQTLLHLAAGYSVTKTAQLVFAARSSIGRWRALFEEYGEAGLEPALRGRSAWTVTEDLGEALRRTYRAARRLVLILDNYIIHKSAPVERWLEANPKFALLFQPTYSPWESRIERL